MTNLAHVLLQHPYLYCPGCESDLPIMTMLGHILNPLPHGVSDMNKFLNILPGHLHETARKGWTKYLFPIHTPLESNPLHLQLYQFLLFRALENQDEFAAFLDTEYFQHWPRQIHQVITSNLPRSDASNLASLLEGLEQNHCLAEVYPLVSFYEFQILQIALWQSIMLQLSSTPGIKIPTYLNSCMVPLCKQPLKSFCRRQLCSTQWIYIWSIIGNISKL